MPKSKNRPHAHHPHQQHDHAEHSNKPSANTSNRVVNVAMVFFAILGLLISYLVAGSDFLWLLAGIILGAATGYLLGRQMSKSSSK